MHDTRLEVIIAAHGVFLTREAKDLGYDDGDITKAVRVKIWHRIRRGAYTFTPIWQAASLEERHRIKIRAVVRSMPGRVAVSHVSNLVERGIAVWGIDLSQVHVTRLDGGAGRIERDVVHHEGLSLEGDVETVNGLPMIVAPRAVVETMTICGVEPGLVSADNALFQGIVTNLDIDNAYDRMQFWPGTRSAQLVVRLKDGRSQSVGETRWKYICFEQLLPKPELQFHVYDEHGVLIGITDLAWPKHGLLGEFDGRVKYGRLLKPGQQPGDAVFSEKVREDLLRERTGFGMIRPIWVDLDDHPGLARRTRRLLRLDAA